MPENVIENQKFVTTNRTLITIIVAVIAATFSATKFYDEVSYQRLINQQTEERIEYNNERLDRKLKAEREFQAFTRKIQILERDLDLCKKSSIFRTP